ncbi:DUF982 domain-containing protein [Bosea sp. BK604]|uniref:DUF982 domain-containing protein n=1 Tax=Bosea sp. BK604 TaxID=2512180 RepID=UPI0010E39C32|nr:DUF982 domain-containing protein [Bosea sp. BK604]TCR65680.1 uncharacterized protein DUF982 [Bosea sp. BK604]
MKTPGAGAKAGIRFHPPVKVVTDRPGRFATVSSVELASEILLSWGVRSHAWQRAVDRCEAASEGRASAIEAREAFSRAAAEAGMLMRS